MISCNQNSICIISVDKNVKDHERLKTPDAAQHTTITFTTTATTTITTTTTATTNTRLLLLQGY